jgi:pimeloyl-ACP methyl ester carboxylesterase
MNAPRITLPRALAALLVVLVVVYAGAMIWLVANETRLVFEAQPAMGDRRPAAPLEVAGHAWLMRTTQASNARPWVIFLHGNASTIASRMNILHYERLRALGLNVIAPEYRGYGGVDGTPSEAGLAEDASRAYQYLREHEHVDAQRIVIYGWSLGSAVAVTLASRVDEAAVILEGAPASVVDIGQRRYPYFPIRLLIRNPFESITRIGAVRSPLLFLHSPEDVVIPIAEGRRLFDAAPPPKQFVEVSGGHVYASEKDPRFFPAIQAFLHSQRLLP